MCIVTDHVSEQAPTLDAGLVRLVVPPMGAKETPLLPRNDVEGQKQEEQGAVQQDWIEGAKEQSNPRNRTKSKR